MADFFISYTQSDLDKAKWIVAQLEASGYTTIAQFKDMPPGSNFVIEMDEAVKLARQTIALLSPEYLASDYCQQEFAAVIRSDPKGKKRLLIPVRVRQCNPDGLLGSVVYIDLVGKDDETARGLLLTGVKGQAPERIEPPIDKLIQEYLNQIKKNAARSRCSAKLKSTSSNESSSNCPSTKISAARPPIPNGWECGRLSTANATPLSLPGLTKSATQNAGSNPKTC